MSTEARKRWFLDGHGCAKNQVDAEEIGAYLEAAGWVEEKDPSKASLIIVNSCGFLESAKKESLAAVMAARRDFPGAKILLAGCLAQRYAAELSGSLAEADGILGNGDLSRAPEAALAALEGRRGALVPPPAPVDERPPRRRLLSWPGSAYVKVAEGCSNRCSYCAIPLIRGPARSRSVRGVVDECWSLLAAGIRELCLVGQDLGSYGLDSEGRQLLPELLGELSRLPGDFWVRVLYVHPDHFPEGVLPLMRGDGRLLPYFDIPFQHTSEPVLRAMNRRGTAPDYLALIDRVRSALPDAVIRSTFLLGFPGETDADFEALMAFREKAGLDWAGAFAYSREEGTAAYSMKSRVPKRTALARKAAFEAAQEADSSVRLSRFEGRTLNVLVEEAIEGEGLVLARSYAQAPDVDGLVVLSYDPDRGRPEPGTFRKASIGKASGLDLSASLADADPARAAETAIPLAR